MASLPEFTWLPVLGAAPTRRPIVNIVSFGDGYELRVGESLNRVKTSWDLTFTYPVQTILEIDAFLTARGGIEAFRWKDTLGKESSYVCREWDGPTQQVEGLYTITATFEEVFES